VLCHAKYALIASFLLNAKSMETWRISLVVRDDDTRCQTLVPNRCWSETWQWALVLLRERRQRLRGHALHLGDVL